MKKLYSGANTHFSPPVQIPHHSHYAVPPRVSSQAQPTVTPRWPLPSQQARALGCSGVCWCCWIHQDLPESILPAPSATPDQAPSSQPPPVTRELWAMAKPQPITRQCRQRWLAPTPQQGRATCRADLQISQQPTHAETPHCQE